MDKDYRFEVYTDYSGYGDKVYVVKYFDLENVIGVGDTIEAAIEEARCNLEVYLEYCDENNIIVPEATIHEELDYSGKITVRMSKTLHKLVDERAKKEGISINLFLNEAISQYVSGANVSERVANESIEKISSYVQDAFEELYIYPNLREQLENNQIEKVWNSQNNLKIEMI